MAPATGVTAKVVNAGELKGTQLGDEAVNTGVAGRMLIVVDTELLLQAATPEVALSVKLPEAPEVFTVTVGVFAFTRVTPVTDAGTVNHCIGLPPTLGVKV